MRRLLRIAFNALTVISLVLAVIVAGLWAGSSLPSRRIAIYEPSGHMPGSGITLGTRRVKGIVVQYGGHMVLWFVRPWPAMISPQSVGATMAPDEGDIPIPPSLQWGERKYPVDSLFVRGGYRERFPGVGYKSTQILTDGGSRSVEIGGAVHLRPWLPFGFTAILPCLWSVRALLRAIRARGRFCLGHCPTCGYDLRATPNRCPECGTMALQSPQISS